MAKFNFWIVSLVLQVLVKVSVGRRSILDVDKSPDLASITAKIIKSCYGNRIKTIGLVDVPKRLISSVSSDDPMDLVNIDERLESEKVTVMTRHKLQLFAITSASPSAFNSTLVHIKRSRWWNHMAQFYVFHSHVDHTGCAKAFEFLWTAWMMGILGMKFICNDGDGGSSIYMFNPYTKHAPAPWKLVQTRKGLNNHPWTLFVRKYDENANICENIEFDQSRDPGGYEVRLTAVEGLVEPNHSQTGRYSSSPFVNRALKMMSRYVNVKLKIVLHPRNETLGFLGKDGEGHGLVADLTNDRSDLVFISTPVTAVPELPGSYPMYSKVYAVTQYTGYPSQWEKVTTAIDFPSRIGLLIVTIVNVIFLKYALRQSFMIAVLNSIRIIICNGSFTKLPNRLVLRIYVFCLFVFVVVIQALYQGQLAARLSSHDRYPNVNNREDLMKSPYVLYGRAIDRVMFGDEAFEGRFVPINVYAENCTDYVSRNSSIACVGFQNRLVNLAVELKLHMSKNPVAEFPTNQLLRQNWPLEARYNRYIFHYIESGIGPYHYKLPFMDAFHTLDVNENGSGGDGFRILHLEDLDFAFVILGLGLGCSIVSFLIERYLFNRLKRRFNTKISWGGKRN